MSTVGWISVKDIMPRPNVEVMIWDAYKKRCRLAWWRDFITYTSERYMNWETDGGYLVRDHITHWLPIPRGPGTGDIEMEE